MKFDFNNIRDRDNLLVAYSEEQIMEAMGIEITEERFCSPFREDERPTCSLKRMSGNGQLYFMDWATLTEPVDVFGLYMYVHGCRFSDAVTGLWELMEGELPNKSSTATNTIRVKKLSETRIKAQSRDWLETDLNWWRSFGIELETLIRFNVRPVQFVWLGSDMIYQFSSLEVFAAYVYEEIDSLKVYFPHRATYRFYHNNASTLQGYNQLPLSGRELVITKALKDVMVLHKYGIPAVAPQSETIILNKEQLDDLNQRFSNVVAFFDNDHAGIIALRKYKELGMKVYMLSRHWCKDISDYYRKYGDEATRDLISKTKEDYYL